jgi:intracellular multiplication protein IcmD
MRLEKTKKMKNKLATFGLLLSSKIASADTIGSIATNITKNFAQLTKLITATSYVTGVGLFMIAIFQFRQHKENPTQVPLSKPMMFLAVAAALLFFPTIIKVTEGTIFGTGAQTGGPSGITISG